MKRDSRFELLRIIAMVMIILSHYQLIGGVNTKSIDIFSPLGEIGVGLFIMISAYFLTGEEQPETRLLKRILTL